MNTRETSNLRIHVMQIANTFISEISEHDSILSLDENNNVGTDPVSNHHLIDLLSLLNAGVFHHYCVSLFKWLSNHCGGHPFALDSYTKFCEKNSENSTMFLDRIAKKQLTDGSISVYTAFLDGGDFFSTLWSMKILLSYNKGEFSGTIEKGISYLLQREPIAARTVAQSGFLLYLLTNYCDIGHHEEIEKLYTKIQPKVEGVLFTGNPIEIINDLYLLEDVISYASFKKDDDILLVVEEKLKQLFELEEEPKLPSIFEKWNDSKPQSPYYQMLLKAGVVAAKYLKAKGLLNIALDLNSHLHGQYRKIKYLGLNIESSLKYYKEQYGGIETEFTHYDDKLNEMWKLSDSEYQNSVFIMMPFDTDLNFRTLTDEIKKTCEEKGFKAFRVDDRNRSPFDALWDNIVLNMLGCKYGVSVYVSEKSIDKVSDELRFFENPNVAMEFGFMKSRGKRILILKDESSKTPSDLQGFVWKPFDMKNPDTSVPSPLSSWLDEIKQDGQQKDSDDKK